MVQPINTGSLGKTYEDVENAGTCGIEDCDKDLPTYDMGGVCWNHAMAIYARVARARDRGLEEFPGRWIVPPKEIVYYVQLGEYIKIGVTGSLQARLATFRTTNPNVKLLATEPGDHRRERQRHDQFAAYRVRRTECFKPHRELVEHINELRQKHGGAAA